MIPRHEHPNPQFERANWLNLNGEWDFEFDFGNSKLETGIINRKECLTVRNIRVNLHL